MAYSKNTRGRLGLGFAVVLMSATSVAQSDSEKIFDLHAQLSPTAGDRTFAQLSTAPPPRVFAPGKAEEEQTAPSIALVPNTNSLTQAGTGPWNVNAAKPGQSSLAETAPGPQSAKQRRKLGELLVPGQPPPKGSLGAIVRKPSGRTFLDAINIFAPLPGGGVGTGPAPSTLPVSDRSRPLGASDPPEIGRAVFISVGTGPTSTP